MSVTQYDKDGKEIEISDDIQQRRKAAFNQMRKKAILIALDRRQFYNIPLDITASSVAADALDVKDENLLQIRKFLIDPKHLAKIRGLLHDANLLLWTSTRPWENMSYRVLSMEYYDDFIDSFTKISDEFEEAVKELENNWDDIVAESKRNLGKAFNKKNYPTKDQIRGLFELKVDTAEFPDMEDIRLNLSGPELMSLQEEISDQYETGVNALFDVLEADGDNLSPGLAAQLISALGKLNPTNNTEFELRLQELSERLNIENSEEEPDESSMMVMDDLEKADFDDEIDEEEDEGFLDLL